MVHTYFDMVRPKTKEYTLNKYFAHKLDEDHYLITVAHGAWLVLNNEEYRLLRLGKIQDDINVFTALENKGIIITNDNFDTIVGDYRERYHYLFNGASLHIIHPTRRCNQKCLYCHAQSKPDNLKGFDMDEKTAKATVDFIFQSPAKAIQIEFQGGEPLLNFPVVKYIIEYSAEVAKKHNKELGYSLVSNLTLMDDEKLEYLMSVQNLGIATSFDGPKYVHDKNRIYLNGKGTYDDVVKWIKTIKSNKKNGTRLNAMPTITKFSLPYPKEIVDEYLRFGFNKTWARGLAKIGGAQATWDKIGYPAHEFVNFWKEFLEYVLEKNRKGIMFSERMTTIYAKKITNKKDPYYSELQAPCGAAIGQMVYDYKGDVFPCDESKIYDLFKLGNVTKDTYSGIHKKPATQEIVRTTTNLASLCDACAFSPYCGTCLIETYATQCNLVSKLPLDRRCIINKGVLEHLFKKILFCKEDRKIISSWMLNNSSAS